MTVRDKLSDLIALLQHGNRRVTRRYLQSRWDCSQATIPRIIAQARRRGLRIAFDQGRYLLQGEAIIQLPGSLFRLEELAALLGLSHWLETLASGVLKERLAPIHANLEGLLRQQDVDLAEWKDRIRLLSMHHRPMDPDILLLSAQAVLRRQRISFLYVGLKDESVRRRNVSPQTLVRYRDNWYLDGYDHDARKLREFALSRARDFSILPLPIKEVPRETLDAYFADAYGIFSGRARKRAILEFEGLAAKLAGSERWHPMQKESMLPGGKVRLEFPCGKVQELARDVMRYADETTVVGPEELRLEVERLVRQAGGRLGVSSKSR